MEEIIKNEDGTITIKNVGSERTLDAEAIQAEISSINDELNFMVQRTNELNERKRLLEG